MTFSYDPALSTSKDVVRFLIGDTVDVGHKVENETIAAILLLITTPGLAAAQIARSIANTYASRVDKAIGSTRLALSQAFDHWMQVAARLEATGGSFDGSGAMTAVSMVAGGISQADRTNLAIGDTDRINPSFAVGQDDRAPLPNQPAPPYDPYKP